MADNANPNAQQTSTAGLSISGRVVSENPHVKMGAFHTLDIEANRDVRIEKEEEGWDSIALARVEESCVPGRGAEVAAVVCGEGTTSTRSHYCPHCLTTCISGTAVFCLLSQNMTVILQRLEVPIPRKIAANSSVHEKVGTNVAVPCFHAYLSHRVYSDFTLSFTRHSFDLCPTQIRPSRPSS